MPKIKCPECGSLNTKLTMGSVENVKGYTRRYKCLDCGHRYGTLEEWCPEPRSGAPARQNSWSTVRLETRSQLQVRRDRQWKKSTTE